MNHQPTQTIRESIEEIRASVHALQNDATRENVEKGSKKTISIPIAILISLATLVLSVGGSIVNANVQIATVDQRQNDQFAQVQQQISDLKSTMNEKFNLILTARGVKTQ